MPEYDRPCYIIPEDPSVTSTTTRPWLLYSEADTPTNWAISNVRVIADVLTMDSGMEEQYAGHLRTNGS